MTEACECSKGYRFLKVIISYAVYLYHRFLLSYRDVQELLFKRGVDVSHETARAWCIRFGPDLAEALRLLKPRRDHAWHLDEMRVVVGGRGGVVHWLWRAVNEYGEVMDVLLQEHRDTGAAKRFVRRLIDDQGIPERVVSNGLRSYGAAIKELLELAATNHVTVSAAERQNNLIEQSHRPTRDQERQRRGFKTVRRPRLSSSPTPKSVISSAIPTHEPLRGCAVATGETPSAYATSCRLACPKKPARTTTVAARRSSALPYLKQLDAAPQNA